MGIERGQTGVVVPFPDVGPAVEGLREVHDPWAAMGVPPHVTVTFPFLPLPELTDVDLSALAAAAAEQSAFEVTFSAVGRFPSVAYLSPEPDTPFRRLTAALLRRWPQAPPYGGAFGREPQPHLTVAAGTTDAVLDEVARELVATLPITVEATGLALLAFDGDRWHQSAFLEFARAGRSPA